MAADAGSRTRSLIRTFAILSDRMFGLRMPRSRSRGRRLSIGFRGSGHFYVIEHSGIQLVDRLGVERRLTSSGGCIPRRRSGGSRSGGDRGRIGGGGVHGDPRDEPAERFRALYEEVGNGQSEKATKEGSEGRSAWGNRSGTVITEKVAEERAEEFEKDPPDRPSWSAATSAGPRSVPTAFHPVSASGSRPTSTKLPGPGPTRKAARSAISLARRSTAT